MRPLTSPRRRRRATPTETAVVMRSPSRRSKLFNQGGHRAGRDFVWLLSELTVEVRVTMRIHAALERCSWMGAR